MGDNVSSHRERKGALLFKLAGLILFVSLWQLAAEFTHSLVIASPFDTFRAMGKLMNREFLIDNFSLTLIRMISGVTIGFAAGFVFGLAGGLNSKIRDLLEPFRWMLMSVPAIVFLVVMMLVLGMGTGMIIVFTSIMLCPYVYVNTVRGIDMISDDLKEMVFIYRFSRMKRIRHLYLPGIWGPLFSSLVIITGNGIRIVVLAEILGASDGLGAFISHARTNLEISELYACVVFCFGVVAFFEFALLRPVRNYCLRWKDE